MRYSEAKKLGQKFSDKEIVDIYNEYVSNDNITLLSVCHKNNIAQQNIRKRFKRLRLKTKPPYIVSHKPINDFFFNNIDSEIKAYLLGFFAADGHIEKRDYASGYALKISISKKDREILELYQYHIANNEVKIREDITKPTLCQITIHSKQIGEDLKRLGYDNRKTYTSYSLPNISEKFMNHFIRGYIDGDGCVYYQKLKKGANRYLDISAYNPSILDSIVLKFPKLVGKIRRTFVKNIDRIVVGNVAHFKQGATIRISDKASLQIIYHYLYNDAIYFLKRKQQNFLKAIL